MSRDMSHRRMHWRQTKPSKEGTVLRLSLDEGKVINNLFSANCHNSSQHNIGVVIYSVKKNKKNTTTVENLQPWCSYNQSDWAWSGISGINSVLLLYLHGSFDIYT
jgi:hypothetical protein